MAIAFVNLVESVVLVSVVLVVECIHITRKNLTVQDVIKEAGDLASGTRSANLGTASGSAAICVEMALTKPTGGYNGSWL